MPEPDDEKSSKTPTPQATPANGRKEARADGATGYVRYLIPLGVALIIGIFVAIGLDEDARERLMRNEPSAVSLALIAAIVGVSVPGVVWALRAVLVEPEAKRGTATGWRPWLRPKLPFLTLFGVMALIGASCYAVRLGTNGLAERENPALSLTAIRPDPEATEVKVEVEATAPAMASSEKMLLRVVALDDAALGPSTPELEAACEGPRAPSQPGWRVLHWAESGPGSDGSADHAAAFLLNPETTPYVCAYVALLNRGQATVTKDRKVLAVTDLTHAPLQPEAPEPTSTATQTTTPPTTSTVAAR